MKTAIITGITGQDGGYLSQLLLKKGYRVVGITRSYTSRNLKNLAYLGVLDQIIIEELNLEDIPNIVKVIRKYNPTEIYNLAAQSSVSNSFNQPIGTIKFNTLAVLNLLESILMTDKKIKFYQASTSEMYGKVDELPITEKTRVHPLSPYAISKAAGYWITINYREMYGLYACSGILFNHESYLRTQNFFVKKVIKNSIDIQAGKKEQLEVGNIEIKRDFGYSPKYVEAMWKIMQQKSPDDFIVCSGESVSLREIIMYVFKKLNIAEEKLVISKELYRPTDIIDIYGDNSGTKKILNWEYDYNFFDVLDLLIEEELKNYENNK